MLKQVITAAAAYFRKQFNHVFIGANGTGKTTLMLKIILAYLKANPKKRVLVIVKDDDEEKWWDIEEIELEEIQYFSGLRKLIINDSKDFEKICDIYKSKKDSFGNRITNKFNGLMVCDDLGGVMPRRPADILNMFKRRRQLNADFLWAFHGLRTDVPPAFWTYVNSLFLFRTSDNHKHTMEQLPEQKQQIFEEAYFRVQTISETKPHYCEEIIINSLNMAA